MDGFKGKFTGKHHMSSEKPGVPVEFPYLTNPYTNPLTYVETIL